MCKFFKRLLAKLFRPSVDVVIKDTNNSKILVSVGPTHLHRPELNIDAQWFDRLLSLNYDEEIKSKYIPELHQDNDFERRELLDILDFAQKKDQILNYCAAANLAIARFRKNLQIFNETIKTEEISIINDQHLFILGVKSLEISLVAIATQLASIEKYLNLPGYHCLLQKNLLISFPTFPVIDTNQNQWEAILDKEPLERHSLLHLSSSHNQVIYELAALNSQIGRFSSTINHKIIVGDAGTGKTHISAHLVKKIRENGDYVLFFKARQFSGDNVNFEARVLQLLAVPERYRLDEALSELNRFVLTQDKRCFIIIDALNETTKSTIGFSNLWRNELSSFTNTISLYSHLYFVCTLRTSYVENIWPIRPANISELTGFNNNYDIEKACEKYFSFYKITPTNFDNADLKLFEKPLVLDLFCKLMNAERIEERTLKLDMKTYVEVFSNYVTRITNEVRAKLNLARTKPICDGLTESSVRFLANNEALLDIDTFSGAFDPDPRTSLDSSIARGILDGYLLFIKDNIHPNTEIIKHTQQEVGGYLLAKMLSESNTDITTLVHNRNFKEKILGADPAKHHQLRLDILKFLICIRPELILHLQGDENTSLAWWYLYNGFDETNTTIPAHLSAIASVKVIFNSVLTFSSHKWFDLSSTLNFNFVADILQKLSTWEFDITWTFFVYNNADDFFEYIEGRIEMLEEREIDFEQEVIVAKFVALVTATTIRELRDLATVYLVMFGKKFPMALVDLTTFCSKLSDSYVYEKVISSIYGVTLIKQHDETFKNNVLPALAEYVYNLQFATNATYPVYNYVVIDSIKHLLDFATFTGVWQIPEGNSANVSEYITPGMADWTPPSEEQLSLVKKSNGMSWPDPIGMDFGIYTIPRLIDDPTYERIRPTIANVYKRIFELGYLLAESTKIEDERFFDFFSGASLFNRKGKVDRLGKKYGWKGFFDYAGVLLQRNQLDVRVYTVPKQSVDVYKRLSDVDIDISMPKTNLFSLRIYQDNLIKSRDMNPKWSSEVKIDSISPIFKYDFDAIKYFMLQGSVEQRINEEYKVRSALFVETFFIKLDKNYDILKNSICNRIFDWERDLHLRPMTTTKVYFGEFYWADNQIKENEETFWVRTGEKKTTKKVLSANDIIRGDNYTIEDIGKEIDIDDEVLIGFDGEPTLIEYVWESGSKLLEGFNLYIPTAKMGKTLNLKAACESGQILDANLQECLKTIEFEEDYFKNDLTYIRADLLKEYMEANNLALVYQIKQHSYDELGHHRFMKYYALDEKV